MTPSLSVKCAITAMVIRGWSPREGEVVHLAAHQLTDLSPELASVGERDAAFPEEPMPIKLPKPRDFR